MRRIRLFFEAAAVNSRATKARPEEAQTVSARSCARLIFLIALTFDAMGASRI